MDFVLDPRFAQDGASVTLRSDAEDVVPVARGGGVVQKAAAPSKGDGRADAKGGDGKKAEAAPSGGKKSKKSSDKIQEEKREAARLAKEERKKKFAGKTDKPKLKMHEAVEEEDDTPFGEMKDMKKPMRDQYFPKLVEAAWDSWWEKQGFFKPDVDKAREAGEEGRFVMVLPPPNVTGSLHLGHTLMTAVEDALSRWHRMHGKPVEWLPGVDHAGIATQVVVEKRLAKERNVTRHELGREGFLAEVWKWKEKYGARICEQMRRLGVSVDWSRLEFTMSERLSVAVTEAFVRMHAKGLIYRDVRLVNWCCALKTAISDIEVDHIELEGRTLMKVPGHDKKYEFGVLTEFAYKVADAEGKATEEELVVATTRLETMLGDTAVAVHPEDARYKHLHGRKVVHPFGDRLLPIILDDVLVDMSFGTGAVKITPAHDPNDFLCGRRHKLEEISVLDDDGRLNENAAPFTGMMRYDARVAVEKALEEKGLFRGKKPNKMSIGVCSRSGDVIEPRLKPQWWVDTSDMAARAVRAVEDGDLQILPESHKETWFRWLRNSRDWCISRQLWWGHRIPAYLVHVEGRPAPDETLTDNWVVGRSEAEAIEIAAAKFGVEASKIRLEQDPDVLDTWFSSGLFPFSTMGWPDVEHPDFKAMYPTSVLETGHDILFFWVARMVMMGQELTGQLPFKTVYLHSLVRDRYGRKMSKSLGNVIDPLEVITGCSLDQLHAKLDETNLPKSEIKKAKAGQTKEFPEGIPECGADALRFGLLSYTVQGQDINLDVSRVVSYRHFCNKLWNAVRFAMINLTAEAGFELRTPLVPMIDAIAAKAAAKTLPSRDAWILSRLHACLSSVDASMRAYNFGAACTSAHEFWLRELCAVYLEQTKPVFRGELDKEHAETSRQILLWCLDCGLRMLHPYMPFVTEELWQRLPSRAAGFFADGTTPASVMIAPFPTPDDRMDNPRVEADWEIVSQAITSIRNLRDDSNLKPSLRLTVYIESNDDSARSSFERFLDDITTLANLEKISVLPKHAHVPEGCASITLSDLANVHVLLKGQINVDDELKRLDKAKAKALKNLAVLEKKTSNPKYDRVPENVREQDAELLEKIRNEIRAIDISIDRTKALA